MPGRRDARGPVDVGADVLAVRVEPAVAGVDPHPDADLRRRPATARRRAPAARRRRPRRRRTSAGTTTKNPSPSVLTSTPPWAATAARISSRCRCEDARSSARVQRLGEARRALDVGEDEGDRPGRQRPVARWCVRGRRSAQCCGGSVFDRSRADSPRRIARPMVGWSRMSRSNSQLARARQRVGSTVDDLGDAGQAVDHRHLAEEVAGAETGELLAVADDPDARPRSRRRTRSRSRPGGRSRGRPGSRPRSPGRRSRRDRRASTPPNSGQAPSSCVRRSMVRVTEPPDGSS